MKLGNSYFVFFSLKLINKLMSTNYQKLRASFSWCEYTLWKDWNQTKSNSKHIFWILLWIIWKFQVICLTFYGAKLNKILGTTYVKPIVAVWQIKHDLISFFILLQCVSEIQNMIFFFRIRHETDFINTMSAPDYISWNISSNTW